MAVVPLFDSSAWIHTWPNDGRVVKKNVVKSYTSLCVMHSLFIQLVESSPLTLERMPTLFRTISKDSVDPGTAAAIQRLATHWRTASDVPSQLVDYLRRSGQAPDVLIETLRRIARNKSASLRSNLFLLALVATYIHATALDRGSSIAALNDHLEHFDIAAQSLAAVLQALPLKALGSKMSDRADG